MQCSNTNETNTINTPANAKLIFRIIILVYQYKHVHITKLQIHSSVLQGKMSCLHVAFMITNNIIMHKHTGNKL